MDRNLIVAIVLTTIIVLFFSSPVYQKVFGGGDDVRTAQTQAVDTKTPSPEASVKPSAPVADSQEAAVAAPAESALEPVQDRTAIQENVPSAKELVLENKDLRLTVSTRGGVINEALMPNFNGAEEDTKAQLVSPGQNWYGGSINDGQFSVSLNDIVFQVEQADSENLVLTANLTGNRGIRREYHLAKTGYMVRTTTALEGSWNDPRVSFDFNGPINKTEPSYRQIRIWPFSMFMPDDSRMHDGLVFLGEGDRVETAKGKEKTRSIFAKDGGQKILPTKNGNGADVFAGKLNWFSVKNKYFMLAAIPQDQNRWKTSSSFDRNDASTWLEFTMNKRVNDGTVDMSLYIGPSSYNELKEYGHNLTQAIDLSYRFLRPLSIVFLWVIQKIHAVIPNWGLVLIAFSLIIKTVLLPLSKSSTKSMKKMSQLQPKISALRTKHKDDPQRLQMETMALYKREGVNPFGGCLPLVLQMPVFFALFPVVGKSFELRQAMFIPYWIEDLSRPDPFFILPIAMGLSFFLQSRQTMTDPNQKSMLYIMPVMMVLMFANFSAGLTLYWLMFNILSWAQQSLSKS